MKQHLWCSYKTYFYNNAAFSGYTFGNKEENANKPSLFENRQWKIRFRREKSIAAARGEAPDVWLGKHGDPGKWLVLRLARRLCGLTLAKLGQRLGGMDYAAVGMGLRRLDQRLAESPPLRRLHDDIARKLDVKT